MKKTIIYLLLLVSTSCCFGQSKRPLEEFGPWTQDPCFKGISFKARKEYYNEGSKGYKWDVIFKNNYNVRVAFTWAMAGTDEDIDAGHGGGRHTFMPGDEITSYTIVPDAKSGDGSLKIKTDRVCFDFELLGSSWIDKCGGDVMVQFHSSMPPYAECDNGKPNQPKNPNAEKATEKDINAASTKVNKEEIKKLPDQTYNRKTEKSNEGNINALVKVDKERINSSTEQTVDYKQVIVGVWDRIGMLDENGKELHKSGESHFDRWFIEPHQTHIYGGRNYRYEISNNIITVYGDLKVVGDGLGIIKYEILSVDNTKLVVKMIYEGTYLIKTYIKDKNN